MPSLYVLSRHKWPFALALLAMVMLFIAPVISKSLEHQRAATGDEPYMMSHSAGMMMEMGTMEKPLSSHLLPSTGASLMEEIACGYCQLLLHIPLIIWLFIPFIWLMGRLYHAPPPPVIAPFLPQHVDAEALPRAPPVVLLS